MKKVNLLSKTEMKNITGGLRNVCDADECVIVYVSDYGGYHFESGCGEFSTCVAIPCGSTSFNKCVLNSDPLVVD